MIQPHRFRSTAGLFSALLPVFALTAADTAANPIPIGAPYFLMSSEDMRITIQSDLSARMVGTYTFHLVYEEPPDGGYDDPPPWQWQMLFPVPPDAHNVDVRFNGNPVPWAYATDFVYETTLRDQLPAGNYPVALDELPSLLWELTLEPSTFSVTVAYSHQVESLGETYFYLYAMGTGRYGFWEPPVLPGGISGKPWMDIDVWVDYPASLSIVDSGPDAFVGQYGGNGPYIEESQEGDRKTYHWRGDEASPVDDWFAFLADGPVHDTDGDGVWDALESRTPEDPFGNVSLPDSDGDGLSDGEEDANHSGRYERYETRTRRIDTDGDGAGDGVEVRLLGTDPVRANEPAEFVDGDADWLPYGADPDDNDPDVDGDRILDGYEAVHGDVGWVTDTGVRPPLGDANCDGFVTNLDALLAQSFFLGFIAPDHTAFAGVGYRRLDANLDGHTSNFDALVLQTYFMQPSLRLPLCRPLADFGSSVRSCYDNPYLAGGVTLATPESLELWGEGDTIHALHTAMVYNCAANVHVTHTLIGRLLRFDEYECYETPADCLCLFDTHSRVSGLSPGRYTVRFYIHRQLEAGHSTELRDERTIVLGENLSYTHTDCVGRVELRGAGEGDKVVVRVVDGVVLISHYTNPSTFNCCLEGIFVAPTVEPGLIRVVEEEDLEGCGCHCLCAYDIHTRIAAVPPGSYRLEVWMQTDACGPVPGPLSVYSGEIVVP